MADTGLAQKGTGIGSVDLTPILQWFQSLGQSNQVQNNNISSNDAQVEEQRQQLLQQNQTNSATGLTDNHAKIMQGLIDKAIKQQAQESLDQVGIDAMQKLVDIHTATSPTIQSSTSTSSTPTNTDVSSNKNNTIIPSPQAAKGIFSGASISPDGTMNQEGIGNKIIRSLIGIGGQSNVDALYNARQLQRLTGQEPLQQSEYQKANLDVNKAIQMAQKVPLTQEQQGMLTAGSNTAKLQIYNDSATRLTSQIDTLNKQFEAEQKTLSPTQVAAAALTGQSLLTPRMKQIQGQLFKLNNALGTLNKQGALLQLQNPVDKIKMDKIISQAPQEATHYSPTKGYLDSQGNQVK